MRDGSDQRLKWARERAGYASGADFIRAFELRGSSYYQFENGDRRISLSAARRFAPLLKVRPEWLYEDDGPPDVAPKGAKGSAMVPRLSWISAGRLTAETPVKNVDIEDFVEIADLPNGDWVALTVRGNSMDRIAPDGSIILVNRKERIERANGFYVFSDQDTGVATFKRYRPGTPPRLQPFSFDPDEETISLTPAMQIFGRVRRVVIDL